MSLQLLQTQCEPDEMNTLLGLSAGERPYRWFVSHDDILHNTKASYGSAWSSMFLENSKEATEGDAAAETK